MMRRGTPEADLQRAVVQALRIALPRSAIIHHCANEVTEAGPRGAKRQAILVGMGVHAGFADRLALIDSWLDVDDTDGAEIDVIVEARATDDDPTGTPSWSDWSRLDSSEDEVRAVELRARLMSQSPDYNVLLLRLRIQAEEVS